MGPRASISTHCCDGPPAAVGKVCKQANKLSVVVALHTSAMAPKRHFTCKKQKDKCCFLRSDCALNTSQPAFKPLGHRCWSSTDGGSKIKCSNSNNLCKIDEGTFWPLKELTHDILCLSETSTKSYPQMWPPCISTY